MSLLYDILQNLTTSGPSGNNLFQILDTLGNGTGVIEQATTADKYFIQPAAGEVYVLKRANIYLEAANFDRADRYGSGSTALTSGIKIYTETDEGVIKDYTEQLTIKKSYQWGLLAGSDVPSQGGVGFDAMNIRWTFSKGCKDIILDGSKGERFVVETQEDISTFVSSQIVMVQGCKKQ